MSITGPFSVGAWLFARVFALVYLIAFASLIPQARGLWSSRGILPITHFLTWAKAAHGKRRWIETPALFWISASDRFLTAVIGAGCVFSVLAFLNFAPALTFFLCWICYLSLSTVGQDFLSFQWDALLLEAGLLTVLLVSSPSPPLLAVYLLWWLLFRLNFASGIVKLASGDPAWRSLTALEYHYETQPIPNRLAWHAHQTSARFKKFSTLMTFVLELFVPLFIFAPGPARLVAAVGLIGLQIMIEATGNYGFFNILSASFCLLLPSDGFYVALFPSMKNLAAPPAAFWDSNLFVIPFAAAIFVLSVFWISQLARKPLRFALPFVRALMPFHLLNHYGLFAVMTKTRPEIIFEGSNDEEEWKPYEFRWKAGDPLRAPKTVAPHQPRLDWQLWFAAMETFEQNVWVQNFCVRLLQGEKSVLALLKDDPFGGQPPKYLRARLYDYKFTNRAERAVDGRWWKRELLYDFAPVISLGTD